MNETPDLRLDYYDSVPVARIGVELDLAQTAAMRERLLTGVKNDDIGLVIDLSATRYIDSAVVNVLFELAERLAARRLRLVVVPPERGLVARVLSIVDMSSVAELHPSVDAAVQTLRGAAPNGGG